MNDQYKNSYKATAKELVSLSVYNVGYQLCDAAGDPKAMYMLAQVYYTRGDEAQGDSLMKASAQAARSEERRVGKECRSRWSPYH